MTTASINAATDARDKARMHLRNKDLLLAEQAYWRVLAAAPGDLEAAQFLAAEHLAGRNTSTAAELLSAVDQHNPDDASTLHQLGVAEYALATAHRDKALGPIQRHLSPNGAAVSLESFGRSQAALMAHLRVINDAQA